MATEAKPAGPEDPATQGLLLLTAIVVLFVVLSLPSTIWPLDPQPDERRYSIAAARMMATGDYLVPRTETGDLRLTKPPLTYYYIVAGFGLLGQTLLGAKLVFLISAAGILGLVYALGRAMGASPVAGALGAAMMAGHRLYFTTATQYVPDTPLILGTTAALLGFVHVLRGTARPWHLYLAWIGIAWAVLAKGFLAPLLVVIYVLVRNLPGAPRTSPHLRRHESIAATLGVLMTLPWFVLMWIWHPEDLTGQFLGDQVTDKVQADLVTVLLALLKTSSALVLLAFPGFLTIWVARRAARGSIAERHLLDPSLLLLLGWIMVNIVIFAFSRQVYGRYVLPGAPAVMALAAVYATRLPMDALTTGLRRAMRILLPVLAIVVLAGGILGLWFGAVGWGVAGIVAAIVGVPLLWRGLAARPIALGLASIVLFFPGIELARLPFAHAILMPTDGQIAARRIADLNPAQEVLIVHNHAQLVDRIGVALGDFRRLAFATALPDEPDADLIVFFDTDWRDPLERAGYGIEFEPFLRDLDLEPDDFARFFAMEDAAAVRAAFGSPLFFATRP